MVGKSAPFACCPQRGRGNVPAAVGFARRFNSPLSVRQDPGGSVRVPGDSEKAPAPRAEDVILFALARFRLVRNSLPSSDGLDSIKVFNLLLAGAEAVCAGQIAEEDWLKCRKVGDAIEHVAGGGGSTTALNDLSKPIRETILDDVLFSHFLLPEPTTGCRLAPDMLLRHASGQLYQEAHWRLEQEFRQVFLPGMASDARTGGLLRKDVRFTPPALARALVERALAAIGLGTAAEQPQELDILDPACGSGVFLQEALRELAARGYSGTLTLRGFDSSPISCEISKFCLERVKRDLPASRFQSIFGKLWTRFKRIGGHQT